mmetsp:Transcript_6311/g.15929  ORF Transcript_6311/g.15929 Transcript_6311/m.15929 type:complete len:278 (-) Transcript_6311:1070-1903(-)
MSSAAVSVPVFGAAGSSHEQPAPPSDLDNLDFQLLHEYLFDETGGAAGAPPPSGLDMRVAADGGYGAPQQAHANQGGSGAVPPTKKGSAKPKKAPKAPKPKAAKPPKAPKAAKAAGGGGGGGRKKKEEDDFNSPEVQQALYGNLDEEDDFNFDDEFDDEEDGEEDDGRCTLARTLADTRGRVHLHKDAHRTPSHPHTSVSAPTERATHVAPPPPPHLRTLLQLRTPPLPTASQLIAHTRRRDVPSFSTSRRWYWLEQEEEDRAETEDSGSDRQEAGT